MIKKIHSEALDKMVKLDTETGIVTVNDYKKFGNTHELVKYSKSECETIKETIGEINMTLHLIKSIFGGVIVPVGKKDKYDIPVF